MDNYYTENLADFGYREIKILRDILNAWVEHGLPREFDGEGVKPAMNIMSGFVFLVNYDYQCAMLNDKQLELFHSLPYSGDEGFLSQLISEHDPTALHTDDTEYIINAADIAGITLEPPWSDYKSQNTLKIG